MVLDVWLHDRHAGVLTNDGGSLSFLYLGEYVSDTGAPALSVRLPLREEAFGQRDTLAFFANLLPEAEQRDAVARGVGISSGNDFALLERFGDDCAGAVTIVDPAGGERPQGVEPLEPISDSRLSELMAVDADMPPLVAAGEVRLSLAGAQPKLPVVARDGEYLLPTDSRHPTTHILKPANARFENLVHNELFCMKLADWCGLSVAGAQVRKTRDGTEYLEVARFDRDPLTGKRLHQEDFCQALGKLPTEKYQAEGGPGLVDCFALIDEYSAIPATDKQRLWSAVVFNFLIGNCDAHAKNFSFLYESRTPRLAPLYDLVSTVAYPALTRRLAMAIGSARQIDDVGSESFEELAQSCELNVAEAMTRARALAERAAAGADPEVDEVIAAGVRQRASRLGV
jgi:serine/threonine-protein kinase HipA